MLHRSRMVRKIAVAAVGDANTKGRPERRPRGTGERTLLSLEFLDDLGDQLRFQPFDGSLNRRRELLAARNL
jgi:hypothetical protein